MRAQEFIIISEGVNDQFLYHGVPDGHTMMQILKSGNIEPQEPFDFDREMDQERGVDSKDRISLTRNQYLHFPYGDGVAQFVIDKNALRTHGYRVVPTVGAMMHYKSENEENVFQPIPVKAPFVVEIQYDPTLKLPRGFLNTARALGVKITPWRTSGRNPSIAAPADTGPVPQNEYVDVKKLKIHGNGYSTPTKKVEPTEWMIGYETGPGSYSIIGPRSSDKAYIQDLYKKIKDRVSKKLSFDDLLPQRQFGKTWQRGAHEIHPGQKGWREPEEK